jgi:hypothetical protein
VTIFTPHRAGSCSRVRVPRVHSGSMHVGCLEAGAWKVPGRRGESWSVYEHPQHTLSTLSTVTVALRERLILLGVTCTSTLLSSTCSSTLLSSAVGVATTASLYHSTHLRSARIATQLVSLAQLWHRARYKANFAYGQHLFAAAARQCPLHDSPAGFGQHRPHHAAPYITKGCIAPIVSLSC